MAARPLTMWTLHFAFVASTGIYAAVYAFMIPAVAPDAAAADAGWTPAAVALLALAFVSAPVGFLLPVLMTMRADPPDSGAADFLARRQTAMILGDAVLESIAIYGLIGAFVGMPSAACYGLMAFSAALMVARVGSIRGWIDEYQTRLKEE